MSTNVYRVIHERRFGWLRALSRGRLVEVLREDAAIRHQSRYIRKAARRADRLQRDLTP